MARIGLSRHGREILEHLRDGQIIAVFPGGGLWCEWNELETRVYNHHHTVWVTPFRALVRRGLVEHFGAYLRGDQLYRITEQGRAVLDQESP
jgi:hypothetical protein